MSAETNPAEPDAVTFMGRPVKQPEVVVFTDEPDAGDVEHNHAGPDWACEACKPLADVLKARMRWPSLHWGGLHADAYSSLARAVMESDWLAAHDAEVRRTAAKETAERIAQAIEARRDWLRENNPNAAGDAYLTGLVEALDEAARIARAEAD